MPLKSINLLIFFWHATLTEKQILRQVPGECKKKKKKKKKLKKLTSEHRIMDIHSDLDK